MEYYFFFNQRISVDIATIVNACLVIRFFVFFSLQIIRVRYAQIRFFLPLPFLFAIGYFFIRGVRNSFRYSSPFFRSFSFCNRSCFNAYDQNHVEREKNKSFSA